MIRSFDLARPLKSAIAFQGWNVLLLLQKSPLPLFTPLGLKRIWSPLLRLRALLSTSGGALFGPSHTSRGLPNFTGAPSHASGALPSASGAPSHTSGALPSASGGPSHTSGALPVAPLNLAAVPSHTSGALPSATRARATGVNNTKFWS